MKTNVYAPFWIIKAALLHMPLGSVIIATTSEQATDPSPDIYDYAQTKAATTDYVRSLAKQLAEKGIRVNGVAPGPIWTPLQVSGGATMEKLKEFGAKTPLDAPVSAAELASIYVQLAANDASYTTGHIYGAAGGSGQPWSGQIPLTEESRADHPEIDRENDDRGTRSLTILLTNGSRSSM